MTVIWDLQTDENGWFTTGRFESKAFLPGGMDIMIFTDDGACTEDAERCVAHFNTVGDKPQTLEEIEKGLEGFFLYMYDEWAAMGIFDNIVGSLKPVMEEYRKGTPLSSFLSSPTLLVYPQQNGDTGYGLECCCPWEPEHQCLILFRNDDVVYVGPSDMLDPWTDEEYLHCVWN